MRMFLQFITVSNEPDAPDMPETESDSGSKMITGFF
jgi:hypothetical protein